MIACSMKNEDPDFQIPCSKKPKKNTALATKKRFGSPLKDNEMKTVMKGHVPLNTKKNTLWALNCFHEWMLTRNERAQRDGNEDRCPEDLFDNPDTQNLNKWIPRFATEVRNKKGEQYPPRSIHLLLAGMQRYMLDKNPGSPSFSTEVNLHFVIFMGLVTQFYRDLHSKGIGTEVKHASLITPEEEEKQWTTEILSVKTPKALQRAVFYYIGKRFSIRGGQEQRNLGSSNFKWHSKAGDDPDCVTYIEHESKNRSPST